MENHLMPYQSVIQKLKVLFLLDKKQPIAPPVKQCCLPIGILESEL